MITHPRTLPAILLATFALPALAAPPGFDAWKPLLGDWLGQGTGTPGEATGGFNFALLVQNQVLVRRNYAEYPATKEKPASRHDDLMVLWNTPEGTRANYWDNEGHVIEYLCSAAGKSWTCETRGATPAFRLQYTLAAPDELKLTFAISPTGKPEAFKTYISAVSHRKK